MTEPLSAQPKPLSVGVIVGGFTPESKIWREALMRLSRSVSGLRDQLDSELKLNVEFHVPGTSWHPIFKVFAPERFAKPTAS